MIEKIRNYFIENDLFDSENRMNVDFLGENATEFSIVKIPINPVVQSFVNGDSLNQLQFQLLSCNSYGADIIQNISNNTFYEEFYKKIKKNNDLGVLPKIEGIETIECLDNGAIASATTNTARYSILMRITYYEKEEE